MEWLRRALGDERTFLRWLSIVAGVIAILKGLRLPYSWPATQAQIDYRYGFLRRGLFGEMCRQLHIPIWRYSVFTAVSFLLLAIFLLLLAWSVRRSGLGAMGVGAFAALIAGSFSISSLVNVVGFYDIVMAVLVLLVLSIRPPRLQLAAALVAGVVGVLVHELYAIAFLPVSLVGAVYWASVRRPIAWWRWAAIGGAILIPWAIVFSVAHYAEMTPAQGFALQAAIRARVDFAPFDAMLRVLTFSSSDNLQLMLSYMRAGSWWVEEAFGLLAFLPTTIFFLAIAFRISGDRSRLVRLWMAAATFAPLLLNFMGFDRYRWLTMMALNAMLCAIAMSYASREELRRTEFGIVWRHAALLLLAVNLATGIGFFEGRPRTFPFQDFWTDYRDARQAGQPLLQPKELFPRQSR